VIKSRRKRWAVHVPPCRRGEVLRELWWGNLRKRERPLGRPRRRCEDNIKMDNKDRWRALVNAVPQKVGNFLTR